MRNTKNLRNVRTLFLIIFPLWFSFFSAVVFVVLFSLFLTWDWSSNFVVFEFYFLDCVSPSCYIELANGGLVPVSEALNVCFIFQWFCFFFKIVIRSYCDFIFVNSKIKINCWKRDFRLCFLQLFLFKCWVCNGLDGLLSNPVNTTQFFPSPSKRS